MANTGAIRAGGAFVEVFADTNPALRSLNQFSQKMQSWGKSLTNIGLRVFSAGAGIVTALSGAAVVFSQSGDELAKMADRTGLSVETLSELRHAASLCDTSLESMQKAVIKLQQNLGDLSPSQEFSDAVQQLGLDLSQLRTLSPDEQFTAVASAIAEVSDPAQRTALALQVFGKSAVDLMPLLRSGSAGLAAMRAEAQALGLTMSSEDAAAAAKFGDALTKLWSSLKGIATQIGAAVAPAITELAELAAKVGGAVSKWMKENRGLATGLFLIASAIAAVGVVLVGLGVGLQVVSLAISGLTLLWQGLGIAIAAITSPVGLIIAGIALAVGSVLYFTGLWDDLYEAMSSAFGSIIKALMSGQLETAGKIAFYKLMQACLLVSANIKEAFATIGTALLDAIEAPLRAVVKELSLFSRDVQKATGINIGVKAWADMDKSMQQRHNQRWTRGENDWGAQDRRDAAGLELLLKELEESLNKIVQPAPNQGDDGKAPEGPDQPDLSGLDQRLRHSVVGTFNPFQASGLSVGNGALERIAKATAETATNTGEMKDKPGGVPVGP